MWESEHVTMGQLQTLEPIITHKIQDRKLVWEVHDGDNNSEGDGNANRSQRNGKGKNRGGVTYKRKKIIQQWWW